MTANEAAPRGVSRAFAVFSREAGAHAAAWIAATRALDEASALDAKTKGLAYLAVLAALRMESGIPFHVKLAKEHGATREEVISAVLLGLQPVGHGVTSCLPRRARRLRRGLTPRLEGGQPRAHAAPTPRSLPAQPGRSPAGQ